MFSESQNFVILKGNQAESLKKNEYSDQVPEIFNIVKKENQRK